MNQGKPIILTDEQRIELKRRVRSQTLDARSVRRARIVLLAAEGIGNHEIARQEQISRGQVITWRGRFAIGGLKAIESDLPCSGRKPRIIRTRNLSSGPLRPMTASRKSSAPIDSLVQKITKHYTRSNADASV